METGNILIMAASTFALGAHESLISPEGELIPVLPAPPPIKRASKFSKRLFWTLNGPLESSIQVLPSQYYERKTVMEPYYRPATVDTPASWHPVSQENIYTTAEQTTTVQIQTFESFNMHWNEVNWDDSGGRLTPFYEADPNFDPRLDLNPDLGIPICPIFPSDYTLTVTTAGDYLTIHEYVSAVHPWLMSIRETLLQALGYGQAGNFKWTSESKLVVLHAVGAVDVGEEKDWIRDHRKPREPLIGPQWPPEERRRRFQEMRMAWSRARARNREGAEAREREIEEMDPGIAPWCHPGTDWDSI